ncbi:DUF5615 family PIN-like protein [Leptolyngbya cf. ectocarpi LEGE 11479]|uniref:DUF5615 family PIN-like protein n=1 Tax=Leptolyngbya cf. ectocarpi LEGE 11479 TaxID=1828722 RepID=A0A928ZZR8_LEPEC|nr:DUF5615 family PIN-like protein [Leptolyngbya ectocarpi]MBE9070437.1 DUF5615 family PIN-like protein [Leptolyngbya cf. ectocarpi LEGE 11479]
MRFLLDVNASGALSSILLELGHDIVCVADIDPTMADSSILTWAVKEKRIIITTDSDFEQMIWLQDKPHHGVLRLENLPRIERISLLRDVLADYIQDLESGAIIIATQRKIRVRRKMTDS